MVDQANPWRVDWDTTYNGRRYWVICRHHPKRYGGVEYVLNSQGTDAKRFYAKGFAEAEVARLNGAPAAITRCAAARDGDCSHALCPQLRDGEPGKTGRHCPLDNNQGESDD